MRKALLVGINDYGMQSLDGCINDAVEINKLLSYNEDGTINFQTELKKGTVNKNELKVLIERCFSRDEEAALFYFSGHGYIDEHGGYLVTSDYEHGDYGVSLQEIMAIANKSKCKNKIIILDSCHAGFMGRNSILTQDATVISDGVTILTASVEKEAAVERDGHGIFTSLLIEALSGRAADILGHISLGSIYAYIDKALGPWDQRPVFKTNVSNFISIRNVNPPIDLVTLRKICTYFPDENHKYTLDPSYEPINSEGYEHKLVKPYADIENTKIFNDLQKFEGLGLVRPLNEEHMYYAAMNKDVCVLTSMGKRYWKLAKEKKI